MDEITKQFLEQFVGLPMKVFLTNGVKLNGKVSAFDTHSLIFTSQEYGPQLVRLDAVATLHPQRVEGN